MFPQQPHGGQIFNQVSKKVLFYLSTDDVCFRHIFPRNLEEELRKSCFRMENGQNSVTNIFKLLIVFFLLILNKYFIMECLTKLSGPKYKVATNKDKMLNSVVIIPLRTQLFLFHDVIYTIVITRIIKF